MDGIYGNKKYLHNSSSSDYYRSNHTRSTNEYSSYNNTLTRQSFFGQYPCSSKYKYSYPSDVSMSTYGYASWGLWRDTGHLASSPYSKKRLNIKSFSILIAAAVFIVLLAILSIAAFAFYFNSLKTDSSEAILVFDCTMKVSRGDIWSSQLKNNQSTTFRQKSIFYKKFIENSLESGNFRVAKTEIFNYGEGPSLVLSFRIYLDMRKIQITITNVEELIKISLLSESPLYRNLKIDHDSIEIKRQLDPEILQQAALIRDQESSNFVNQEYIDPPKKSTASITTENVKNKFTTTKSSSKFTTKKKDSPRVVADESMIDTDNLPVIQGSFEITKTDADITHKRNNVKITSTMKPFQTTRGKITNVNLTKDDILEKFVQHQNIINDMKVAYNATSTTENYKNLSSTTEEKYSDLPEQTSTHIAPEISTIENDFPKLDTNLFTTAPIIDNQPWLPINPATSKTTTEYFTTSPTRSNYATFENIMYRNKITDISSDQNDTAVQYQSFYNSDFSGSSMEIEKLGAADVKPYPLPVNKIIFSEESTDTQEPIKKENFEINYDKEKFEHLGGGVVAKKPELNSTSDQITTQSTDINITLNSTNINEEITEISLLTTTQEIITEEEKVEISSQEENSTEKLNFMNMKDYINKMQNKTANNTKNSEMKNNTLSEAQLFPSISKWEFINGTRMNSEVNVTRKVFNETLQAVVVENDHNTAQLKPRIDNNLVNDTAKKANLQQLSSIFDTLASKLGLPEMTMTSKIPPFSQQSQNKLKQNINRTKMDSTTTTATTTSKSTDNFTETLLGQAEVEAIDPTKYDEILSMGSSLTMTSSTPPSLVTLLPPKSNSAIRIFKPPIKKNSKLDGTQTIKTTGETVVKTSLVFGA